jgi:hypothetical protein
MRKTVDHNVSDRRGPDVRFPTDPTIHSDVVRVAQGRLSSQLSVRCPAVAFDVAPDNTG